MITCTRKSARVLRVVFRTRIRPEPYGADQECDREQLGRRPVAAEFRSVGPSQEGPAQKTTAIPTRPMLATPAAETMMDTRLRPSQPRSAKRPRRLRQADAPAGLDENQSRSLDEGLCSTQRSEPGWAEYEPGEQDARLVKPPIP